MLWLQLIYHVKSKHNLLLAEFTHRPISPKKGPESDRDQLQNPASTSKRSKATIWEVLWCRLSGKLSPAEEINFWLNKFRETRSLGMNRLYSGTEHIRYQQMRKPYAKVSIVRVHNIFALYSGPALPLGGLGGCLGRWAKKDQKIQTCSWNDQHTPSKSEWT